MDLAKLRNSPYRFLPYVTKTISLLPQICWFIGVPILISISNVGVTVNPFHIRSNPVSSNPVFGIIINFLKRIYIIFFSKHMRRSIVLTTYLKFSPNIHPISFCVWFSQRNVLSITPPFSLIIRHLLVRNDIAVFRCIRGSRFLHSSTANVFENKVSKN